ncbi:MAG: flagellar biosynthesis anti-sigma factor FlgM [Sphingomonadales bacterium]|nr:MAG: flagellar biosynthesis anti-sigma factor FlgM [Sphingomonadales bacterium]TNF02916.1 MAG: flagellar biosynthesis anti-sigma factor FlgM [Sphingomonadales bacterium]
MIKSIGQMAGAPVDLAKLREGGKTKAATAISAEGTVQGSETMASTPAARMAAQGAPIDMDRVAAIKEAIASGNYPVDADRIADRMIELDLGA